MKIKFHVKSLENAHRCTFFFVSQKSSRIKKNVGKCVSNKYNYNVLESNVRLNVFTNINKICTYIIFGLSGKTFKKCVHKRVLSIQCDQFVIKHLHSIFLKKNVRVQHCFKVTIKLIHLCRSMQRWHFSDNCCSLLENGCWLNKGLWLLTIGIWMGGFT